LRLKPNIIELGFAKFSDSVDRGTRTPQQCLDPTRVWKSGNAGTSIRTPDDLVLKWILLDGCEGSLYAVNEIGF
jgi:hypothetical protein